MHLPSDHPAALRVICYARIGSGRADDQEAAIRLQAARIKEFAERHNVQLIAEYTDLGVTRSAPWRSRPAACALTSTTCTTANLDAVAIIDDPVHVFGPDNIAAVLAALPIPVYQLAADQISAVDTDSVTTRITAGISDHTAVRPRRRARPFRARSL